MRAITLKCRIKFLDHGFYISALEHVMNLILSRYVLVPFINAICDIVMPERFGHNAACIWEV